MTLMKGGLAIGLFCFLIGLIWPTPNKSDFSSQIVLTVAKSLWLSWLVVVISYLLNIGDISLALMAVVVCTVVWRYKNRKDNIMTFACPGILTVLIVTGASALLIVDSQAAKSFLEGNLVLSGWDINMSWNRWAMQLYENQYSPYNAAYPVFIPGIWSLIYKAQSDPLTWVLPKVFLLIFPIIVLIQNIQLAGNRKPLAAIIIFLVFSQIFLNNKLLLSGLMDSIVMMLILISGIALYLTAISKDSDLDTNIYAFSAALFAGIGAITKQPGMLAAVIVGISLLIIGIKKKKNYKWYGLIYVLLFLPLSTFMAIYLTTPETPTPLGNISHLAFLTSNASGGSFYEHAWKHIVTMFGRFPLLVILTGALLNFVSPKRTVSQIGLLYLSGSTIAFFAYSNCCAYDERNGWFMISLLGISCICGVSILEHGLKQEISAIRKKITAPIFWKRIKSNLLLRRELAFRYSHFELAAIGVIVVVAVIAQISVGESQFLKFAKEGRRSIVWPSVNHLIYSHLNKLGNQFIITNYPFVAYLPDLEGRYRSCSEFQCVSSLIAQHPGSVVLLGRDSFDYPELRKSLKPDDILGTEEKHGFSITRGLSTKDLQTSEK
ncbi:hypothetical protein EDC30_1113 [Paucimonas lemoignei]|uniref:Dolichyl-phosphate-mannose-protein mannosyltransferase n=1 Tax=Paucimonas lemoignei TaxID=29443 RepID=A0A4R3HR26_PAULE|nr:hypothetical protein [Paucimonas lemoignei]TCS35090.1 hypothetical protein EDC30_1113 [Paucimonas lemoignei]